MLWELGTDRHARAELGVEGAPVRLPIRHLHLLFLLQEGRCKATCKREFKLPWREAGPPHHHDDKVDSDQ